MRNIERKPQETKILLPELDKNRIIDHQSALVFDADCHYDVILG